MRSKRFPRIPEGVRFIYFDAVGTLIHPDPPAGEAYFRIGRRFGSRLALDEVVGRFAAAFKRQEGVDAATGLTTSETREWERWRLIVAEVLDDVSDPEGCFLALHDHFARPEAWRCDRAVKKVLRTLRVAGYTVGIASNFDRRLRGVVGGLRRLAAVRSLVISSEVGWKKPAPGFFAHLGTRNGEDVADQVLLVGDDPTNDLAGARKAGLHGLLLDPLMRYPLLQPHSIRSLAELLASPGEGPASE
jgi:putative hydrolase of the HAD superfamily